MAILSIVSTDNSVIIRPDPNNPCGFDLRTLGGGNANVVQGPGVTVTGTGTVTDPFVVSAGCACNFGQGTNTTVTGTGSPTDPFIINSTGGSGTPTTIIDGTGTSVTGTGTAGDPFQINVTGGGGTPTFVTQGANVTVTGAGTAADPYVVSATQLAVQQGTGGISITGTGTPGDPLVVNYTGGPSTVVTQGTGTTVTGSGTVADPYVVNATGGGAATVINDGAGTTVNGAGTAASPYTIDALVYAEGDGITFTGTGTVADPIVISADPVVINPGPSGDVTVTGAGTAADPFIIDAPDTIIIPFDSGIGAPLQLQIDNTLHDTTHQQTLLTITNPSATRPGFADVELYAGTGNVTLTPTEMADMATTVELSLDGGANWDRAPYFDRMRYAFNNGPNFTRSVASHGVTINQPMTVPAGGSITVGVRQKLGMGSMQFPNTGGVNMRGTRVSGHLYIP